MKSNIRTRLMYPYFNHLTRITPYQMTSTPLYLFYDLFCRVKFDLWYKMQLQVCLHQATRTPLHVLQHTNDH